jgi:uncharacterized membrane protein YfcA
MIHLTPYQWALGAGCGFLAGVAKTGMPALAILMVPLMILAVGDARQAAGWLLPVLCTADVFAIVYWRRHSAARALFALTPWVLAGMVVGAAALAFDEGVLRVIVGVIVVAMLGVHVIIRRRPKAPSGRYSVPYGVTAGFATTVANAAGPVMNLYLLGKRLPKEEFLATGAWFFFVINLTKVPVYTWHGLITARSLAFAAVVAPVVLVGAVAGKWFADRMSHEVFEGLIVVLTIASTMLLFL